MSKIDDSSAFVKIYICAREKGNGEDKLTLTFWPITREGFGDENTEIFNFAKRCTAALNKMMDEQTEDEIIALRKEVRDFIKKQARP